MATRFGIYLSLKRAIFKSIQSMILNFRSITTPNVLDAPIEQNLMARITRSPSVAFSRKNFAYTYFMYEMNTVSLFRKSEK